jgi:hypothetical protein
VSTSSDSARIFISYRTSDGVDKATALARELDAVFGAAQVFLDKEDLPAGLPWREAVGATLDDRPVLLLLVTPQTFAPDRIADPNDPVRREICAALECGAHVIPLLADGVEQLPPAAALPAPLDTLAERTWRRLRAYDWREDVERLVADLQQLGIVPSLREPGAAVTPRRRVLEVGAAFGTGALAGAALTWWAGAARVAPASGGVATSAEPAPTAAAAASSGAGGAAQPFAGTWVLTAAPPARSDGMRLDSVTVHISQFGETVKLHSAPIDVRHDPAWTDYAARWKSRAGFALETLILRGEGQARLEHGHSPAFGAALRLDMPGVGGDPIESGRLSVEADEARITLTGLLWLNGEQAQRNVRLMRSR